jgi:hypothetical protein
MLNSPPQKKNSIENLRMPVWILIFTDSIPQECYKLIWKHNIAAAQGEAYPYRSGNIMDKVTISRGGEI